MAESESGYSPPELEVIQTLQEKVDSPEKNNSNESFCPAVLLAKYDGLLKGEVVELPSHAVIALDIESFSTLQNSGPEFVTQISELTMAYRSKMVEMSQNEKYGDMLFLKSAGDELLFAQDYRDIGDFLRVSLFVIDGQIAFNELLEQDEFAKIKQFYKNKNLKETQFVQPGICIPTAHQKHNLALKLADIDGQLELVTVGSSLVAKKWAREFYTGAQFGVVEDNGFSSFQNVF